MRNVEADLPSIKFLTQQRDSDLGIRCFFYSQMNSQPCKIIWVLHGGMNFEHGYCENLGITFALTLCMDPSFPKEPNS